MRLSLVVVAVFVLTFVGCPKYIAPPVPVPAPDSSYCSAMCDKFKALNCPEGKDLYDSDLPGPVGVPNETCVQDCQKQESNGVFYNPKCTSTITSCDQIEAYRKKTCN